MKLKIYSIYDSKAQMYGQPFFQHNSAVCERSFRSMATGDTQYAKAPQDFTCYELGEYDDSTGIITSLESPLSVFTFNQFIGGNDA